MVGDIGLFTFPGRGEGEIGLMVSQMYKGVDTRLHPAAGQSVLAIPPAPFRRRIMAS